MDNTLEQFHHDFRQRYLAGAEANQNYQLAEFLECVSDEAIAAGDLEGYEFCHYNPGRGIRVDGYWFDDEGGLSLFVADFDHRPDIESLTQTEAVAAFKRVSNFFDGCLAKDKELYREMDVTTPEYGLARQIYDRREQIVKITLFLASDRRLSERIARFDEAKLSGRPVFYQIWDLSRLYRQSIARGQREPLEIDFEDLFGSGLPCLPVNVGSESYSSFLVVVPGRVLADLYERFGARLLEQNVRAFLTNRGSVNKGIRTTILNEPAMFFAYNNGITATASEVACQRDELGTRIRKVTDLQIVNGGQTTASLFHTRRNDRVVLTDVHVQMKLSVIQQEEIERVVPRIAEYANTQNKVNAADLFSNSPFHIRLEEVSRRLFAPQAQGAVRGTKWFYERARGQFADELSKRSPTDQKRFLLESPKHQVFTKTDLAKFENVWDDHPRFVNLGAQKNFVQYAQRIAEEWKADDRKFNEYYFKRAVVRAIIFRATERIVSGQPWYSGGYRANAVAYGIACLAELAKRKGLVIDVDRIWKVQSLPDALSEALKLTTEYAYAHICSPAAGVTNVTEWCKRERCWDQMLAGLAPLGDDLPEEVWELFSDRCTERDEQRHAIREQVEVSGIQAQAKVMEISCRTWRSVRDRLSDKRLLTQKEVDIIALVARDPQQVPSGKQAQVLLGVLQKATDEGIDISK